MDKKYIICVDDKLYFIRMEENTFLLSANKGSARVFSTLESAEMSAKSMKALAKDFGECDNVKVIEIKE